MRKFIENNLLIKYKKSIGLNSSKLRKTWFIKNNLESYYDKILSETNFLLSPTMGERIYVLFNEIKTTNYCSVCGDKLKFANFVDGYRIHCGKRDCSYVLKSIKTDENGLTANQRSGKKLSETLSNNPSILEKRIKKGLETKLKNGTGIIGARKAAETKMNTFINGVPLSKIYSIKSAETMKNTFIDGKSINELRIQKMVDTKSKIDENGLDSYDRGFINGAGKCSPLKYYNEEIIYQGTYEKYFLDEIKSLGFLDKVERGPRIPYNIDNKEKIYRSDFLLNNVIFEIKSDYTYLLRKRKNNIKFSTAIKKYHLIIIFNKEKYLYLNNIDFKENTNLYKLSKKSNIVEILEFIKNF
jgi:hypothetical protein